MKTKFFTVSNFDRQSQKRSALITGTGATVGAAYALRNPSENVCKRIADSGVSIVETLQGYKNSFNMQNAVNATLGKSLSFGEFAKTFSIVKSIENALSKELIVDEIHRTPLVERTKTFSEAVSEANKARSSFRKTMLSNFSKELKDKLISNNVFDNEKFADVMNLAGNKLKVVAKELSKEAIKGAAKGAAIGAVLSGAVLVMTNVSSKKSETGSK